MVSENINSEQEPEDKPASSTDFIEKLIHRFLDGVILIIVGVVLLVLLLVTAV